MEFSVLLLKKTFTLAAMVLMGFYSVKSGRVKSEDSSVLSRLCFDWVIPCSVFSSFLIEYTPETARDFAFSFLVTAVTVVSLIIITLFIRKPLKLGPSDQGTLMFSNSAGMALPLASALFGAKGILLCAPQMGIQNFLIFTFLPVVMVGRAEFNPKKTFLNRNIIAIFAGIIIFVLRIPLPAIIKDTASVVGNTLPVLSMFMIGMLMGGTDLKALFSSRAIYLVTFLRLIGYPLLFIAAVSVSGITRTLPFTRDILLILLMCESSPAAALVTQMSEELLGNAEAGRAGSMNVLTTLPCVITIPLMVFLYQLVC